MPTRDTITLNGVKYFLDTEPDVVPYQCAAQDLFPAEADEKFWDSWAQRSWNQGERKAKIITQDDLNLQVYDDSLGIDVSTEGEMKLQPSLDRDLAISSATLPMCVSNDGLSVVVGATVDDAATADNQYVRRYNAGAWTKPTTPQSGAVTDLIVGTGSNMYGVQGSKIIKSTDDGATWANDATASVPTDMVALAFCANQLYALGPTYLKYYDGAAWQTAASWGGTSCCTHGENVYFAQNNILYKWNGQTSYQADRLPQGFAVAGLYSLGDILFIAGYFAVSGGKKGAVFYIIDDRRAHMYNVGSYDGASNYTISAIAGSDDEIYVANQKRGGVDRYDIGKGGLSCGPTWGEAGVVPFKGVAYSNGMLFVARYDTNHTGTVQASGTDTTHVHLANAASAVDDYYNGLYLTTIAGTGPNQTVLISDYVGSTRIATVATMSPAADATTTYFIGGDGIYIADVAIPVSYEVSGWLTTSEYDFLTPNETKIFSKIMVHHDALLTGQSVLVEYSLDSGGTWASAGTSNTVGATSKAFSTTTAKARSIKLRLTLGGGGTNTPTVTMVRVDAATVREAKYMWDLNLIAYSAKDQGRTRMSDLKTANSSQSVLTFVDRDGTSHSVIITLLQMQSPIGDRYTVRAYVRLREVLT